MAGDISKSSIGKTRETGSLLSWWRRATPVYGFGSILSCLNKKSFGKQDGDRYPNSDTANMVALDITFQVWTLV